MANHIANRNYPQSKIFSFNHLPVRLTTSFSIGATGAVSGTDATHGIKSITRLAVGTYRIQFDDNYFAFVSAHFQLKAPVTGSGVAATALTPGVQYEIISLGTTTQAQWVTAGVPAGITAAPGVTFLAAATSTGTGSSKAIGVTGISQISIVGNPATMLSNQPFVQGNGGGYLTFQTVGATDATTTTPIATDPASGSQMYLEVILNNSSLS